MRMPGWRQPRSKGTTPLIWRPSLLLVATLLVVLIGTAAVMVAPAETDDAMFPIPTLRFWWARIAPTSFALHKLRTVDVFVDPAPPRFCVAPEDPFQAWQTILQSPDGTARFRDLLAVASPAGRLFALTGLAALGDSGLSAAVHEMSTDTAHVKFWVASSMKSTNVPVAALAQTDSLTVWVAHFDIVLQHKCAA